VNTLLREFGETGSPGKDTDIEVIPATPEKKKRI
jgi:hypothetical protein